jgi:hypothetical protein
VKAEPQIDVSPVPAPPGLLVVARISKPDNVVAAVGSWTNIPLPTGADLVRTIAEDSVADVVDLSQPVDAAMTVGFSRHGVEPDGVFSVAVKKYEDAKTELAKSHKLVAGANGQFKIEGLGFGKKKKKHAEEEDDEDSCVLAPGASGGRIVCGSSAALEVLVPYMSRTLPKEKWPHDVHIEVRPEPVRGPLRELKGSLPMLARGVLGTTSPSVTQLIDASLGEAIDVLDDAQLLTMDAKVAESGVVLDTKFAFQSKKSLFARMLTTHQGEGAPPAFWHLPGDADTAIFVHGSDPKLFDHPREILSNLILEGAQKDGLPEAESKALNDLVAERLFPLFTSGNGIYAKGYDPAGVEKAIAAAKTAKDENEAKRVLTEQAIGWLLYRTSEPIAKVGPVFKDAAGLWNKPGFAKWVQSKQAGTPRVKVAANPAGLPKDTVHLEVTIPREDQEGPPVVAAPGGKPEAKPAKPAPKKVLKPFVVHVFSVPDGAATWIAVGLDAKLVAQKAAASLASAPDANTLGKAQGVEALRDAKLTSGGLLSLRGFAVLTALNYKSEHSPYDVLASLPTKGSSPIVFAGREEANAATSSVTVSRAVIGEIVKLATAAH